MDVMEDSIVDGLLSNYDYKDSAPHGGLHDIHNGLLSNYDYKDSAPPPVQPGVRVRPGRNSQDGLSQQQ